VVGVGWEMCLWIVQGFWFKFCIALMEQLYWKLFSLTDEKWLNMQVTRPIRIMVYPLIWIWCSNFNTQFSISTVPSQIYGWDRYKLVLLVSNLNRFRSDQQLKLIIVRSYAFCLHTLGFQFVDTISQWRYMNIWVLFQ
jgi:hypothetical protein